MYDLLRPFTADILIIILAFPFNIHIENINRLHICKLHNQTIAYIQNVLLYLALLLCSLIHEQKYILKC